MFYLTFCAAIYHFYVRKKDDTPAGYALVLSTLMICLNIMTILFFVELFFPQSIIIPKVYAYYLMGFIGVLNYLLVFRTGRYKEIQPTSKQNWASIFYIVISFTLCILVAKVGHDRNVALKEKPAVTYIQ